jgi:hypothetical protein
MFSHRVTNVRLSQNVNTWCSKYIRTALPIVPKKEVVGHRVCFLCIFVRGNISSGIKNMALEEVRF